MHSKIRNTHEHHPFIYSYASYHVDMCLHLWAPSSAIYVYLAPGTEIVNFFCQGSRPKYDSPRGWTFEDATEQNRWQLEWVLDVGCTKCDRNTFKERTSHYLTKWMTCTLQEPIAISNTTISQKHPNTSVNSTLRQYRLHRTPSEYAVNV